MNDPGKSFAADNALLPIDSCLFQAEILLFFEKLWISK